MPNPTSHQQRRDQIAELYAREADNLLRTISRRVTASSDVIDGACFSRGSTC